MSILLGAPIACRPSELAAALDRVNETPSRVARRVHARPFWLAVAGTAIVVFVAVAVMRRPFGSSINSVSALPTIRLLTTGRAKVGPLGGSEMGAVLLRAAPT